jgi:hypothetical protein
MNDLEKLLGSLHSELAKTLLAKVRSGEATAADLNVARQFLKDNNIDALPKDSEPLKNLVHELPFTGDEDTYRH